MADQRKSSRTRQRLREMAERLSSKIEILVAERGPVVKGLFQMQGTRCGKPNCKCMRGELHPTAVLAVSKEGKRHNLYVRVSERPELQRRSERYRRFRQARAKIAKLSTEILKLADVLLDSLSEPYLQPSRRPRFSKKQKEKGKKRKA